MAQFGGFLNALGQAFGGYGQDQQIRFQRGQDLARLAMQQQGASDAHIDALLARATNYPLAGGTNPLTGAPGAGAPVSSGPPQPPLSAPTGPMIRRGDGFTAASGAPQAPQPASHASGHPSNVLDQLPTDVVDVPGYGRIDRWGGLRKQLLMKQLESDIDTNAKVNVAGRTGETAKNLGDVDPDTQARIAAARALATLPVDVQKMVAQAGLALKNSTSIEQLRGSIQAGLQTNQQLFDLGKLTQEQKFAADQQVRRLAGDFLNQSSLENQRASSGIVAPHFAAPAQTVAPSSSLGPVAPAADNASADPRATAVDAMLKAGMTPAEIKAALGGTP